MEEHLFDRTRKNSTDEKTQSINTIRPCIRYDMCFQVTSDSRKYCRKCICDIVYTPGKYIKQVITKNSAHGNAVVEAESIYGRYRDEFLDEYAREKSHKNKNTTAKNVTSPPSISSNCNIPLDKSNKTRTDIQQKYRPKTKINENQQKHSALKCNYDNFSVKSTSFPTSTKISTFQDIPGHLKLLHTVPFVESTGNSKYKLQEIERSILLFKKEMKAEGIMAYSINSKSRFDKNMDIIRENMYKQ